MSFDPAFLKTFTEVLEDAKSQAPKTPLSVELAKDWNKRVFKQVASAAAGEVRGGPRTRRWLDRNSAGDYFPVDVKARSASEALARVRAAYDNFERGLPSALKDGDIAKALAWPVLATLDGQPFEVGNFLTATICLNFAAKRANLELTRIDWKDPDLRYRIYLGLRPGEAGAEPLADYLRPRLGTQESPEGAQATHIADLDQVGHDGGHGSGTTAPPANRRHFGGGPRDIRRHPRRPPLPPPEVTDYP
jgi:hypothetical protein